MKPDLLLRNLVLPSLGSSKFEARRLKLDAQLLITRFWIKSFHEIHLEGPSDCPIQREDRHALPPPNCFEDLTHGFQYVMLFI